MNKTKIPSKNGIFIVPAFSFGFSRIRLTPYKHIFIITHYLLVVNLLVDKLKAKSPTKKHSEPVKECFFKIINIFWSCIVWDVRTYFKENRFIYMLDVCSVSN